MACLVRNDSKTSAKEKNKQNLDGEKNKKKAVPI